jgi:predicted dehydrogenase
MGGSDRFSDPKLQITQAVREIREALHALRENVVVSVMRRNKAQDDLVKLEQMLAVLDAKAAQADKLNNPQVATDLREERKRRAAEVEDARKLLDTLTAQAESAKINLPEEEARLLQQARDLQAQLVQTVSERIDANAPEAFGTEADALWERAAGKTRDLQNEASARTEVSGARAGVPASRYDPQSAPISREATAEAMLAELETRLGKAQQSLLETKSKLGTGGPETQSAEPEVKPGDPARAIAPPSPPPTLPARMITRSKGETSRMEPTERVRVAAIGTGNIFRGAHLPAYPDISQAQLVAFCDPDKQAQEAALQRYHHLMEAKIKQATERNDEAALARIEKDLDTIQICDDISEVIETVKPDLVDICTQPFLHAPLSIQALEAGINVMCEKPISRSWLESQRVIEAVKRTGKLYQHNENWLWDADWYTAKKLVDSGAIGEPILMFLATAHGGPEGRFEFWNSDFGGGGALLDNGIHAIGASWYVSGLDKRPTYVKAAQPFGMSIRMPNRILNGRFQQVQVDDDAHILIRFENPQTLAWTTAHVEGSWSHRDSPDTVVIGTTGKIVFVSEEKRRYAVVMDAYERESRRIEVSGPTWQHWPSSFYGEILNMVECVRNNTPSISDAAFGAECSAVVGASYLSERDGRRAVSVEEFKQFARDIAARYPGDPSAADNALVDALLSAVRKA